MATRKAAKKAGGAKKGGAREFAVDRNKRVADMVKAVQASKEKGDAFLADPAGTAKQYGVTLAAEEVQAIKFLNGLTLASAISKSRPLAFFDNNCSCGGGGGTAGW